jgi:hypothetical protein
LSFLLSGFLRVSSPAVNADGDKKENQQKSGGVEPVAAPSRRFVLPLFSNQLTTTKRDRRSSADAQLKERALKAFYLSLPPLFLPIQCAYLLFFFIPKRLVLSFEKNLPHSKLSNILKLKRLLLLTTVFLLKFECSAMKLEIFSGFVWCEPFLIAATLGAEESFYSGNADADVGRDVAVPAVDTRS